MKIKLIILSLLLLLTVTTFSLAQNYINRHADESVYDVEVIVFGQTLAQPPQEQVMQAAVFPQDKAVNLGFIAADANMPKLKKPKNTPETADPLKPSDQTQVPLTEVLPEYQVLVWYLLANNLSGGVVDRLASNPKYKPLIRKVWRQPVTPFDNPLYVKVNNREHTESGVGLIAEVPIDYVEPQPTDTVEDSFSFSPAPTVPAPKPLDIGDYEIQGQVALSRGRFTHLHIKFNYYRINNEGEAIIYATKQQKQIDLNQWQYFDHQQFGVLVKVSAVKAEELL